MVANKNMSASSRSAVATSIGVVPDKESVQDVRLPVTLISGFLGSGKTTLLQHILQNKQGLRCAVIVNDMAELNIDAALINDASVIQKEEKLVEMQNGCICCTLREDLLEEVSKLAREGRFDYLVIESTGISEPIHVAETFTFQVGGNFFPGGGAGSDQPAPSSGASAPSGPQTPTELKEVARLDTCVSVVDAVNFDSTFNTTDYLKDRWKTDNPDDPRTVTELMVDQIEFADILLLNKIDMVNEADVTRITRLLRELNPTAEIIPTKYSDVPLEKVLNTNRFNFERASELPGWLQSLNGKVVSEADEYGISNFIYRSRRPFKPAKLFPVLVSYFQFMAAPSLMEEVNAEDDAEIKEAMQKLERKARAETSASDLKDGPAVGSLPWRLRNKSKGPFAKVLRSKGFFWLTSKPFERGMWSTAGAITTLTRGGIWFSDVPEEHWPGGEEAKKTIKKDFVEGIGDKRNEIVFIGLFEEDDKERLIASLDACLVDDDEFEQYKRKVSNGPSFYDMILAAQKHAQKMQAEKQAEAEQKYKEGNAPGAGASARRKPRTGKSKKKNAR